jgi:ABC-type multidrug transport system ATPase subunit
MIRIQAQGIGKRFNREWIFRNLTAEFKTGNIYAITGPNGSGKSTLVQALCGQMPLSQGVLTYYENEVEIPIEQVFEKVSIAAPYLDLIDEFSLHEQVRFHATGKSFSVNLTENDIIEQLYLQENRNKFLMNFSSGMKQRVKLALALFSDSPVIFLDEPGTNLDRKAFTWYLDNLQRIKAHKLIFIASNQPEEYPAEAIPVNLASYKM